MYCRRAPMPKSNGEKVQAEGLARIRTGGEALWLIRIPRHGDGEAGRRWSSIASVGTSRERWVRVGVWVVEGAIW